MTYKVQITGFAGTHEQGQVSAAFAQLFKLEVDKAVHMLSRLPLIIKEGIDADTAQKYRSSLEKIGLLVDTPLLAAAVAAPAAPLAASAPVVTRDAVPPASPPAAPPMPPSAASSDTNQPGMKFRIEGRPDFAFLTVQIPANQTIKVEASAMATMDTHLKMKTKMRGGLGRFLTGESIFVNEFTAENVPGEIGIAPAAPGDIAHVHLDDNIVYLQNSAFVACDPAVTLETKWQGLVKGFFSGESLFLIRASGHGDLWFNTYGGMIELDVDGDYVVDTGNIVAFTDGLEYRISKVGGYKSLFFSGEGLVCRFSGKGKVWIQTRTSQAFVSWAHWFRPTKGK